MSESNNQKRRHWLGWIVDKIFNIICWLVVIYALTQIANTIKLLWDVQSSMVTRGSTVSAQVYAPEDFLPEGFDPSCPEYQAALQRYNVENGLLLPEEKEAAPELAGSEAVDTENSAS